MAGFMTTDCEKKQWLKHANAERKEKPDVLSVGLPAANYSFFAVIPENNISYIAFQHQQTHTHIYIYIYTSENLGENQNNISIRFFHGECHQEIKVYTYICIYICVYFLANRDLSMAGFMTTDCEKKSNG